MKWDTHHTKEITEKYVYRYLTIEKLIDFLDTNSIYLARLDTFEDNLENIEPYDINELKFLTLSKPENTNPEISEQLWGDIIKKSIRKLKKNQDYLIKKQKKDLLAVGFLVMLSHLECGTLMENLVS